MTDRNSSNTCFQKWTFTGCFLMMMFWASGTYSQISSERYVVDHWTTEDGLPVNAINEVIQSSDGYIWMATFDGLVRFDGLKFKIYDISKYPSLTSNRILRVKELDDGSLWMLTEQRFLIRYLNGKMQRIDTHPDYYGKGTSKFFEDHRGWLWLGSDQGLNVYRDGTLEPYKPEAIQGMIDKIYIEQSGAVWYRDRNSLNIFRFHKNQLKVMAKATKISDYNAMLQASGGSFYLSTGEAVYRFMGDSLMNQFPQFEGQSSGINFHQEPDGSILMATVAEGIYRFRNGNIEKISVPDHFLGLHGQSFYYDKKKDLWKFSRNRLYKNDRLVYQTSASIRNFTIDKEGSIWLATEADGLYRLKPSIFSIYSIEQGMPNRNVYPILETEDGSIWLGTHENGLAQLAKDKVKTGFKFSGLGSDRSIRSLEQLSDGTLLVGLYNSGVYSFSGQTSSKVLNPIDAPEALQQTAVYSIFEDSDKRLWVGSQAGLFLRINNTWNHVTRDNELPHNYVRYAAEAPDGSVWFATNGGGIVHYNNELFTTYGTGEGLSSNVVREIHIEPGNKDDSYTLWIGTEGRGLNRIQIQAGRWIERDITHFDEMNGLFDNGIHRILEDNQGNFWMSSNRGIYRVAKADLEAFHRGEINQIRSVGYTEKDGLLNREANGGNQPAGIKDSSDRLWFPTQNGAVVIDPDNIQSNKTPPPVVIESVSSEDQPIWNRNGSPLKLKAGQRNFEVTYTALSLLVPAKNQFKYKLEGFDEEWRTARNRRTAFYTNVPPGEYTFRVIASNNDGLWNETGAALNIIVPSFFYETTWFYSLCGAGILLLMLAGVRWRIRRLAKAEQELTALVQERTDELRLEKQKTEEQAEELKKLDEIKSRFFANLSHEFRTPLTLIINPLKQMLSGSLGVFSDEVSKRQQLMLRNSYRLLRLIDQLLDLSRMEEGRVQIEVEETELTAFTKHICELFELTASEKGIDLTVQGDCEECWVWIDKDKMEKVIANLLSNAIKYTEPGGAVEVRLEKTGSVCKVVVSDNGPGISKEQQQYVFDRFYQVENSDARRSEGAGIGLAVVREFVELHEGEIFLDSMKGRGTCFTVVLKKGNQHFSEKQLKTDDTTGVIAKTAEAQEFANGTLPASSPTKKEPEESFADDDVTSILVVEDNTDLRAFVSEMLSEYYRVFEADNGQAALEIIQRELPDLIVADIMMPGMDGHALNRELKKDPSLASIPLIFLTAKTASKEKVKGFAEGADDYLTKPFNADVLLARINNLIESRMRLRNQIMKKKEGVELDAVEQPVDSFLVKLNELLENSFGDPALSISSIANQLHIDRTQLYRKVKTKTQLTPQQYVLQFRLNKAAQMFREQSGSVSEVAYASGFNSLSYFAIQFREQFGRNPSEFLARLNV